MSNSDGVRVKVQPAGIRIVAAGPRDVRFEPIAPVEMTRSHRLVGNEFSLISAGTELAFYAGTHVLLGDPLHSWAQYPYGLGYASVGRVLGVPGIPAGPGPSAPFMAVGQRVYHMGKHATQSIVDCARAPLAAVPENLDPREATFARMSQITWTAKLQTVVSPGKVHVIGAGIVGIIAAQQQQNLLGAQVTIYDVSAKRLELARACGVERSVLIPAGEPIPVPEAKADAPDLVIDATGVQALVPQLLSRIRSGGQVILLGSPRGPVELDVYRLVHLKNAILCGAHESLLPERSADGAIDRASVGAQMLGHIASGKLIVRPLISHEIAPEQIVSAYEGLLTRKHEYIGVIIRW